ALIDHLAQQRIVLRTRAVDPVDAIRLRQRGDLVDPAEEIGHACAIDCGTPAVCIGRVHPRTDAGGCGSREDVGQCHGCSPRGQILAVPPLSDALTPVYRPVESQDSYFLRYASEIPSTS